MKLTQVVVGAGCLLLLGSSLSPSLAQENDFGRTMSEAQETGVSRHPVTPELLEGAPFEETEPSQSISIQDELNEFEDAKQYILAAEEAEANEASAAGEGEEEVNEDLRVPFRAGIGYSSSGPGFDGFGQFEGFIPVWQELGEGVVFLETRLLIDNGAHLGGNLLLGGRHYFDEHNQVLGGYASFDTRSTGDSTFYQLGLGFERLSRWDFRANAYVPLGDTSNQVSDSGFVDTGSGASSAFVGRQLVLTNEIERTRITRDEVALVALDLEAGGTIARWDGGDIRGYAGTYAYLADRVPTTFGWKVRLDARPQENLTLGLAVQGDELFGTNIVATVGATFPRLRPGRELSDREATIARMSEPVYRNNAITVDTVTETEREFSQETSPLFNPEEEEVYRFTHVTLGVSGGDGTFENPFGTVEEALQATVGDGNDIVYVDGEANIPIPAFSIPDRVSVLSQGPEQRLAGLPFPGFPSGSVRLPFNPDANFDNGIIVGLPLSGDGVFPTITGGGPDLVTLGNNTVLAGFQLEDAPQRAIAADSVTNIELRNNHISWTGANSASGIALENVTDRAILFDNSVTGAGDRGISLQNTTAGEIDVEIAGYQLEDNSVGLEAVSENLGVQLINIGPSSTTNTSSGTAPDTTLNSEITGSANEGLILRANDIGNQELTFTSGSITNNGAGGVLLSATNNSAQDVVSFDDTIISDNGGPGIQVIGGLASNTGASRTQSTQEVSVNNSEIARNAGDGVRVEGFEFVVQGFSIGNSSIVDNQGAGIRSVANSNSRQEFNPNTGGFNLGIGNNIITGNAEEGITLTVGDSSAVDSPELFAEIEGNTLADNNNGGAGSDIVVTSANTSASACVFIAGNSVPSGIELTVDAPPAVFEVQDLTNFFNAGGGNSPTNGFAPVTLTPDVSEFSTPSGDGVCFQ
ncbi:MAG: right-handed parallel beta-helix repeat-containing protein [Cyanobacteria bacterium J06597_1]